MTYEPTALERVFDLKYPQMERLDIIRTENPFLGQYDAQRIATIGSNIDKGYVTQSEGDAEILGILQAAKQIQAAVKKGERR